MMIPTTTNSDSKLNKPVLIVITGPTASGKTDYAIHLAQYYNTEIISADSRQVFKEMNIGTAKPTDHQLRSVKHHFINHCSIEEEYNAGIYEKEVLKTLEQLFLKHKIVILVGGTGLYIKAVCEGLDILPKANPQLRKELDLDLEKYGIQFLKDKLNLLDPNASKSIDFNNPNRLMRAIELVTESGKPLSELKTNSVKERPFNIVNIYMNIPRVEVYHRINQRVDSMLEAGLVQEAKTLYPKRNLNALKTVGYQEVFEYIEGKITFYEMSEKIKQHTRNYAKRQITWFKSGADCIPHDKFELKLPESYLL